MLKTHLSETGIGAATCAKNACDPYRTQKIFYFQLFVISPARIAAAQHAADPVIGCASHTIHLQSMMSRLAFEIFMLISGIIYPDMDGAFPMRPTSPRPS
jgi:hypothetical protein